MEIKNPVLYQIWKDRYSKDSETIEDNLKRVAKYTSTDEQEEKDFYNIMNEGLFFPAGRTMSNSGIGKNLTLNNCFTLNFVEDSIEGIFEKVKIGAKTQQVGGGTGYEFSKIRPKGTPTSNEAIASGVVSFMEVFNSQTATILQGNRRGANMSVLSIYHPDIYDYISAKSYEEGKLVHFNMSVMIDDDFMIAVKNNNDIDLHYPIYDDKGNMIKDNHQWKIKKTVKAKELWDLIIKKAYDNGEPGVLFYNNMNKDNTIWYMENVINTNPCSEYISGTLFGVNPITKEEIDPNDYMGACNLGSLFLHNFVLNPFTKEASIDFNRLKKAIHKATRMLDNIIDINKFPHQAYENYQKNLRTIGLGDTGIANVFTMLNIKYGSQESIKLADYIENFISKEAYKASIELAKEKGSFPFLDKKRFVESGFIQKHIKIDPEWEQIANDILKYGIRNARIRSIAPCGTLSLTYGKNCSSSLEPIFSLSYDRKVKIGGQSDNDIQIVKMEDYSYSLWKELKNSNAKDKIIVNEDVFVTAMDLSVKAHLDILKTIAFHIDMSCSKTINIPTEYLFEETKKVYEYCWENGIKGCTIFRPNPIRQGILITSEETVQKGEVEDFLNDLKRGEWKPKAKDTFYYERKIYIGCGKLKLMIGWSNSEQCIQDLYVIRSGQGGCERNLQGMVIAMSGMLRLGGNIFNIEKAFEGVGGCNSFISRRVKGEKLNRGSSCGTAILNEIKTFLNEIKLEEKKEVKIESMKVKNSNKKHEIFTKEELTFLKENGEIVFAKHYNKCPECGETLENSSGCSTCVTGCGWSKCS